MELKHKECFCPATVSVWDLQPVSKYARQAAEFMNLYSRSRGWNRFPALVRTLDLLFDREEVKEVGVQKPDFTSLRAWIETTDSLSSPALRKYCEENDVEDDVLLHACRWGEEDAASDLKAAQDNGVLFYPIVPGKENESWKELETTAFGCFTARTYPGVKMDGYVSAFLNSLPETVVWP